MFLSILLATYRFFWPLIDNFGYLSLDIYRYLCVLINTYGELTILIFYKWYSLNFVTGLIKYSKMTYDILHWSFQFLTRFLKCFCVFEFFYWFFKYLLMIFDFFYWGIEFFFLDFWNIYWWYLTFYIGFIILALEGNLRRCGAHYRLTMSKINKKNLNAKSMNS